MEDTTPHLRNGRLIDFTDSDRRVLDAEEVKNKQ